MKDKLNSKPKLTEKQKVDSNPLFFSFVDSNQKDVFTKSCFAFKENTTKRLFGVIGQMYLVTKKKTNVSYCLKILKKEGLSKEKINKIYEQLKIMSQVKHPNFLHLCNHFEEDGNLFVVFEFIEREYSLLDLIHQVKLDKGTIINLFHQTAAAVEYLHSSDIVYNSVEPDSIFFHNGFIKLIDYGWSKFTKDHLNKRDSFLINKTHYINAYTPPEVFGENNSINRSVATKKSDIWQLGVLLFEMITGKLPFKSRSDLDFISALKTEPADFSLIPDEYSYFKKPLEEMLEKDPKTRISLEDIMKLPLFKDPIMPLPNFYVAVKKRKSAAEEVSELKEALEVAHKENKDLRKEIDIQKKIEDSLINEKVELSAEVRKLASQLDHFELKIKMEQEIKEKLQELNEMSIENAFKRFLPLILQSVKELDGDVKVVKEAAKKEYTDFLQSIKKYYKAIKKEVNDFQETKKKEKEKSNEVLSHLNKQIELNVSLINELKQAELLYLPLKRENDTIKDENAQLKSDNSIYMQQIDEFKETIRRLQTNQSSL